MAESRANQQLAGAGVAIILGNIVLCGGSNTLGLRPIFTQAFSLAGIACTTLAMLFVDNYTGLFASLIAYSFVTSSALSLTNLALEQALPYPDDSVHAMGHCMMWCSIPVLVGPPAAGKIARSFQYQLL